MADRQPDAVDTDLLEELRRALRAAGGPVVRIEAGIALSIALGRQRTPTACGGCSVPLAFEGIPATTAPSVPGHFRLILSGVPEGADTAPASAAERGWVGSSP